MPDECLGSFYTKQIILYLNFKHFFFVSAMSNEGEGYSDEPVQGFPNDTGNVQFVMVLI